jgi:hypothetical protein
VIQNLLLVLVGTVAFTAIIGALAFLLRPKPAREDPMMGVHGDVPGRGR